MKAAVNRRAAQLSKLAIKLNSDDFTIFCDFMGHIKHIHLRVYVGGWTEYANADLDKYIDLKGSHAMEQLEGTIKRLQEIKDNKSSGFVSNVSDQGELTDGR